MLNSLLGEARDMPEALGLQAATVVDRMMRIYIFKSETTRDLRAFAGDPGGSKLPPNHGPWTATGVVAAGRDPPHNLSRNAIERAIGSEGFQLWRLGRAEAST
jgi:hypothetical protein